MDNFTYRKAELKDTNVILESMEAIYREAGCWGEDMIEAFMEGERRAVPRQIKAGTLIFYLAYSGDAFAGMGGLLIWQGGHKSSLGGYFYTMPAFRGQGIMHRIVDLQIQKARECGCHRVCTCTEEKYRSKCHEMGFQDFYDYLEDESFNAVWGLSDEMEIIL